MRGTVAATLVGGLLVIGGLTVLTERVQGQAAIQAVMVCHQRNAEGDIKCLHSRPVQGSAAIRSIYLEAGAFGVGVIPKTVRVTIEVP